MEVTVHKSKNLFVKFIYNKEIKIPEWVKSNQYLNKNTGIPFYVGKGKDGRM